MIFLFLGLGGWEIILVFLAVLLLFGADKIPDFARTLGKGINEFRKATDEIKKEFTESTEGFKKDLEDSKRDIEAHVKEVGRSFKEDHDSQSNISTTDNTIGNKSQDENNDSEIKS